MIFRYSFILLLIFLISSNIFCEPNVNISQKGSYSPTFSNTINLDSTPILNSVNFYQLGNFVKVFGSINVDLTTANISTQFYMSLPVASDFASGADLYGTATRIQIVTGEEFLFFCNAYSVTDVAACHGTGTTNVEKTIYFELTYIVRL